MKRNLHILIIILASLISVNLFGQNSVSGIVTDSGGQPIPGTGVIVKGTSRGTSTDTKGHYALMADQGTTLVFSCLGYETKEVKVTGATLNVVLADDTYMLNEVVAIGYGSMKSNQVTNSISKVTSETLTSRPVTRIDHALQGQVAGVRVTENTGEPGVGIDVNVRGINSVNHASGPLYVVDGFPVAADMRGFNVGDIESIEVLKDASAAAIYGSRGSGGVILITTKSGKTGKPVISLDMSFGLQERFSKVDVLGKDDYLEYALEERVNSYIYQGGDLSVPETKRQNYKYAIDPLWRTNPELFPDNDWQDIIDRIAPKQNYTISVSGGTPHVKYYVSTNWLDQQGIIYNSGYKQLSFQSNVEGKANDLFAYGLNLHASYSDRRRVNDQGRSIVVAPIVGIDQQTYYGGMYYYVANFWLNPYHMVKEIKNKDIRNDMLANAYVKLTPIKGLEIKSSVGFNFISYHTSSFTPINVNRANPSTGTRGSNYRRNILNENTATYNIEKDDWTLNLLAGFTYQHDYYNYHSFSKKNFSDDSITTANGASVLTSGTGSATEDKLMSILARANFSLFDRYFLSASIRRDGSSRFGDNKKWGTFPAVSGGWMISKENFFQPVTSVINSMKLRISYGGTGNNNIGDYAALGTLSNANGVYNNQIVSGYVPGGFSNPDLTWEKTFTLDAGIDFGFFNNRINLSLDGYIANTSDMILSVPVPETTGFGSALQNIGKLQNKGWEMELQTRNLTGAFTWTTNFNLSYNRNKVKALGPDGSPIIVYNNGFPVQKIEIGKPLKYFYLFEQDGLFKDEDDCIINREMSYANKNPQPGDIKYKDQNGDGKITEEDKTDCGKIDPDYTWGLTNKFGFKGIELSIFIDGVSKCKLLDIGRKETTQSRGNVPSYWLKRWRSEENPGNGKIPRACTTDNLTTPSDFWLSDAQFWRIRNINLSYTLPKSLMDKIKYVSSCRIYVTVDNVYMHDHFYHLSQNAGGYNYFGGGYPLARTYEAGINITF